MILPPSVRECKPEEASGGGGGCLGFTEAHPGATASPEGWGASSVVRLRGLAGLPLHSEAPATPCRVKPRRGQSCSLPGLPHSPPSSGCSRNLLLQEEPVMRTRGKRRTCHRAHPWSHGERGQARNHPAYLLNQPHQQLQKEELEEEEESQGECNQPSKPWSSPTTPAPSKAPACRFLSLKLTQSPVPGRAAPPPPKPPAPQPGGLEVGPFREEAHHLKEPPQEESLPDPWGTREVQLVAQSRGQQEVVEVCRGQRGGRADPHWDPKAKAGGEGSMSHEREEGEGTGHAGIQTGWPSR